MKIKQKLNNFLFIICFYFNNSSLLRYFPLEMKTFNHETITTTSFYAKVFRGPPPIKTPDNTRLAARTAIAGNDETRDSRLLV